MEWSRNCDCYKNARMRKPSIQTQARFRLALLLVIPVLVGSAMWLVAHQAGRSSDRVKHTLLVELSIERLLSDLKEAETGQRGYLLTGEAPYLDPYHAALGASNAGLANLTTLTADNSLQQNLIDQIRPLVNGRLAQLSRTIELYDAGQLDPATERASLDRGKALMDSIRSLGDQMRTEEQRLLADRELDSSHTSSLFYWSLAGGYGLMVLVVGSLYAGILRYGRQRAEAENRLSLLNDKLDQRVRERTAALEAREALLNTFVKYVPASVAMFDREMRYLQASDRWWADFRPSGAPILGKSHYELFPDLPERWKEIHRRSLAGETLRAKEDRWDRDDGTQWLHWEIRPWGDIDGLPQGVLILAEDITERKQIEQQLRESEATTRALLETAAQAIVAVDRNGSIVFVNRMTGQMFGYEPGELLGKPHETLLPVRFRESHAVHRGAFAASPKTRPMGIGMELCGARKDGSEFPIEVSLSSVEGQPGPLYVAFVTDITVRKLAETALRDSEEELRALTRRLMTAQEDERRRIARDLHDDVTQHLAFLSMEIGRAAAEIDGSTETHLRCKELQDQVVEITQDVRRISHGLHPSVIEDFGLATALEELCPEFTQHYGIHVEFDGPNEEVKLNLDIASNLYRVAQEALSNAAKHSGATVIVVTLIEVAGQIQLSIKDNGAGVHLSQPRNGLGIASMKERMRMVGGRLSIASGPEEGTEVLASVPVSRGER